MADRHITIFISEQDAVLAAKLASARKLGFPIWPLLVVGMAVSLFILWWGRMDNSWAADILAPMLIALIVVVALVQYVLVPWQARRQYQQSASVEDEIAAVWDEGQLRLSGDHGSLIYAWSDYHRWSEDSAILLLYHSDATFNVIPKSALTKAQCADIIALLEATGVKKR